MNKCHAERIAEILAEDLKRDPPPEEGTMTKYIGLMVGETRVLVSVDIYKKGIGVLVEEWTPETKRWVTKSHQEWDTAEAEGMVFEGLPPEFRHNSRRGIK